MIEEQKVQTVKTYATSPTYSQEPPADDYASGVAPLDTLPAQWWNWLWNQITLNEGRTVIMLNSIFNEIISVLTAANISPDADKSDQLKSAIALLAQNIATASTPGSVVSSINNGTVAVSDSGVMSVNGFGNTTLLETTEKDTLVGAINELHTNEGDLTSLTTSVKTSLVNALNEVVSNIGDLTTLSTAVQTSLVDALNDFIGTGGNANGYATLDDSGRIPASQLPLTSIEFKGTWNASTNTPTLVNGTGTNGDMYIVSTGGTFNGVTYRINDRIIYDGSTETWTRLGGGNVTTVNSLTGDVVLTGANIMTTDGGSTTLNASIATKAPIPHASTANTYGVGTEAMYGHNRLLAYKLDSYSFGSWPQTHGVAVAPWLLKTRDLTHRRFTYTVYSDDTLKYWLTNKASGSQGMNGYETSIDFTSVLIMKGSYNWDGATAPTALNKIGTSYVYAETGAKITFSSSKTVAFLTCDSTVGKYNRPIVENLRVNLYFTSSTYETTNISIFSYLRCIDCVANFGGFYDNPDYSSIAGEAVGLFGNCHCVRCNVLIDFFSSGSISTFAVSGFYNCYECIDCHVYGTSEYLKTPLGASAIFTGFNNCNRLQSCTFETKETPTMKVLGFYRCTYLSNCLFESMTSQTSISTKYLWASESCAFSACTYLTTCDARISSYTNYAIPGFLSCTHIHGCYSYVVSKSTGTLGGTPYAYAFSGCYQVLGCEAYASSSSTAINYYGSYSIGYGVSTYACANTPNGGFNN